MTPENLARWIPFDLESLEELSRPLPDEEIKRGNVGTRMSRDMGGFVLISDAEVQGCIEYVSLAAVKNTQQ
jgi:hypothetical protein